MSLSYSLILYRRHQEQYIECTQQIYSNWLSLNNYITFTVAPTEMSPGSTGGIDLWFLLMKTAL